MAQVSSGSFTTNASEGRSLTFNWSVDSTSIADNYKKIYWSLVGSGGTGFYVMAGDFKVVIDGETVYNSASRIQLWNGTVVASGYKTLYHDATGNKRFSASVQASIYEYAIDNTGSGTWDLPTIPRYVNITSFSVAKRDETSVIANYTVDATCNAWQYSINGGGWVNFDNSSAIIYGLSPNTTYNIKVRLRRADSGLWTESGTVSQTTYNYPHCTSSPDFTIGDNLTLDFYNPLGRSISVIGYAKTDGSRIFGGYTTGTRLIGFNDSGSVNNQYASIPNSQSGQYKVVVSYGNIAMTRDAGNVYRIRGNEIPTINDFDYIDNNETGIVNITGDNHHIVQNKSILSAKFNSATPNFGAGSIVKYKVECNGKSAEGSKAGEYRLGAIDSANDVDLTLTVTDSRGLTASKTKKVTVLEHSDPQANVTLQRLNNYEDRTFLTVDGSISSVNGKNEMFIKYRYKVSGGSYGEFIEIGNRSTYDIGNFDKNTVYIFNIVVTDSFGSKYDREHTLDKGVFPLFIDTQKNSVGINKFPVYEHSLEASGLISLGEANSFELATGESKEIYIFLAGVTALVNFRIAGANLEIAKLFYVFRPTQYFGVHNTLVDDSFNNTGALVPFEVGNATQGYKFTITNNHSSPIIARYGILELC